MGVEPQLLHAERVGAAAVAVFERSAEPPVGGALGGVDPEQLAVLPGEDDHLGVAGQVAGGVAVDERSEVEATRAEPALGVNVVVEHDLVPFASMTGSLECGIQGVGALG